MSSNPYDQPIDTLRGFTHPAFRRRFHYMNDSEAIVLARRVLKKIIESGHKRVIVIESGTAPLIYILRRLQEFEKSGVTIHQIKIPRDTEFSLLEWFYAYLSPEELDETVI